VSIVKSASCGNLVVLGGFSERFGQSIKDATVVSSESSTPLIIRNAQDKHIVYNFVSTKHSADQYPNQKRSIFSMIRMLIIQWKSFSMKLKSIIPQLNMGTTYFALTDRNLKHSLILCKTI
jgi:hypothetical protein